MRFTLTAALAVLAALTLTAMPALAQPDGNGGGVGGGGVGDGQGNDGGDQADGPGFGNGSGSNVVRINPVEMEPALALAGETGVVAGAIHVEMIIGRRGGGNPFLTAISLASSGSGVPEHDIADLRLVLDADADNTVDADDRLLGRSTFLADGSAVVDLTLLGSPLELFQNEPVRLLVVVDVSETVIEGRTFNFTVDNADFIAGTPRMFEEVAGRGLTWAHDRAALLTASRVSMPDHGVETGSVLAPVLALRLRASRNAVRPDELVVCAAGDMVDTIDILEVRIVHDRDRNGQINGLDTSGGDESLGSGVFVEDDGRLTLSLRDRVVSAGGELQLLVCATFNTAVPVGAALGLSVQDVAVSDDVLVSGLPLTGPTITIIEAADTNDREGDGSGSTDSGSSDDGLTDPWADSSVTTGGGCSAGPGNGYGLLALLLVGLLPIVLRRR